jgi:hypothetical protein
MFSKVLGGCWVKSRRDTVGLFLGDAAYSEM